MGLFSVRGDMTHDSDKIGALIGSRICHDLISPVGAVANGLELLERWRAAAGPEWRCSSRKRRNASARIRFFRLAFGDAGDGRGCARCGGGGRSSTRLWTGAARGAWRVHRELPRARSRRRASGASVRRAGAARRAAAHVATSGGAWCGDGRGRGLSPDPEHLWALLEGPRRRQMTPARCNSPAARGARRQNRPAPVEFKSLTAFRRNPLLAARRRRPSQGT